MQIRDVPEALRDRLADIASERGQSLQAYLRDLVNDEVRRRGNLAVLERFSRARYGTHLDKRDVVGTLPGPRLRRGKTSAQSAAPNEPSATRLSVFRKKEAE